MGRPSRARALLLVLTLAALFVAALWWLRTRKPSASAPLARPTATRSDDDSEPELTRLRGAGLTARPSASAETEFTPPTATRRDRELRERARQRILQGLARETAPQPGTALPAVPTAAPELDKDYIRERIRGDFFPMAKECYEAALERDGGLAGRMVFQFVIVGDEGVGGIVESAELDPSSTLAEQELVTCMRESLLSVTFPPPPKGGRVTVTYPFMLSPGDGG